jgi:hypothetical protein
MRKVHGGSICTFCDGSGLIANRDSCGGCLGKGIQLTTDEFDLIMRLDDSILDAEFVY